jgi:hypothetical protein
MANAPAETPKLKGEAVGNLIRALQQGISWRPRRSRLLPTIPQSLHPAMSKQSGSSTAATTDNLVDNQETQLPQA